jgi:outer membrane protein
MWWLLATLAFGMDLDSAREQAVAHAIAVEQAQADVDRAEGTFWVARSGALPSVELFASTSTGAGLTSFGFDRPVRIQAAVGATGRWTLVAPASWASGTAARHSLKGQRAMLDWSRVTARREATIGIAELWAAQEIASSLADSVTDAEQAMAAVQSRVDSGLRPPAEAARSQATTASLRARSIQATGEVAAACAGLYALLRQDVPDSCSLVSPTWQAPRAEEGRHPGLVAADEALAAAQASRAAAAYDRLPTVAITGTAGDYFAGDRNGFGWSAGAEARMPLVSGGSGVGENTVAVAVRQRARLAVEDEERRLAAARVAAKARYDSADASVVALQSSVEAADAALRLVDARYSEGLESLDVWLGARRERDDARVALAQGQAATLAAVAELESVNGVW